VRGQCAVRGHRPGSWTQQEGRRGNHHRAGPGTQHREGSEEGGTMNKPDSRSTILGAARQLFSEHGYQAVTIRDIATAARVYPALMMKHYRSKAELFNEMGPNDIPLAELDLPRSQLGRALVQKILTRREHGISDPLLVAVSHVRESPEPHRTREEVR